MMLNLKRIGISVALSAGTKADTELIGRSIKHKNNAEPKTNWIQRYAVSGD